MRDLVATSGRVRLDPFWQRSPAWKAARRVLLVDTVLRGMDIPKIYLRAMPPGGTWDHEAVDGQQRLRALWDFHSGAFGLDHPEPLPPIEGQDVRGATFGTLPDALRERFENFEVSVTEIVEGSTDEITNLFSRLQMGVPLNPAELRNAMAVPMRHVIDALATSHPFFVNGRVPDRRYKRQDFVAHAFAMAAYDGQADVKAVDLKRMVLNYGAEDVDQVLALSARVGDAMNVVDAVNALVGRRITQKWIFVDLSWIIMQRMSAGAVVSPAKLAAAYTRFETRRRAHVARPEGLLGDGAGTVEGRHVYDYLAAFRTQGGTRASLQARNTALRALCSDIDGDA